MTRRTLLGACVAAAWGARLPWPLGANTAIEGYGLLDAIHTVKRLGFSALEFHTMGVPEPTPGRFPGFQFDRLDDGQRRLIRRALSGFRHLTAHLPYTGLDYMASEADARTVEIAMDGAAFFGARLAVLHPQPVTLSPRYLARFRQWGDRARGLGLRLGLETGYPRSVREFVSLIREIDHSHVGATIDVGHQRRYAELIAKVKPEDRATPEGIRAYNDTTLAIVEQLVEKVFHFHVHDIDPPTWDEHKPLIHGFVDYPRLFAALRRIRYQGVLVLEIGGPAAEIPGHLRDAKQKLARQMPPR
ncbi:MAG: sugar phosphate isomerase/epimerase [Acidobacteria bacterium]|nr:sugar phosphate isomerase/epimerase [Acidobacteriota bacterium]